MYYAYRMVKKIYLDCLRTADFLFIFELFIGMFYFNIFFFSVKMIHQVIWKIIHRAIYFKIFIFTFIFTFITIMFNWRLGNYAGYR